jgi:hypothetical protein
MSYVVIKEIPVVEHKATEPKGIKEQVLNDITDAYATGVSKFELVGYYDSSPEYIGSCAREMAYKFLKETLFDDAVRSVKKKVIKNFRKKIGDAAELIRVQQPRTSDPAITVKGITVGGTKRIFVQIDYDYINRFETDLLDKTDKKYADPDVQRELIEKAKRRKWK